MRWLWHKGAQRLPQRPPKVPTVGPATVANQGAPRLATVAGGKMVPKRCPKGV